VTPLHGALLAALAWLAIATLSLVPWRAAAFARRAAFPLGALAGVALGVCGAAGAWLATRRPGDSR
jgi:hypothetical protein